MTKSNAIPGLNFRIRHLVIILAYFVILRGLLVPVVRYINQSGLVNPVLLILVVSPWILGLLVLGLERKGPVKYWAAPLLLSLTAPALAIYHDWAVVDTWLRTGTSSNSVVTLTVNFVLIGSFTLFLVAMRPEVCPDCQRRGLIPLLRLWTTAGRTSRTHWCGFCGGKFWRDCHGTWRNERRKTWVDDLEAEARSANAGTHARDDSHPAHLLGTCTCGPHSKNPHTVSEPAPSVE